MNWLIMAASAVAGGIIYSLVRPEEPCAVAWSGSLDAKADVVVSALANAGFTVTNGRLKQEVLEFPGQPRVSTLLVKPSELEAAKAVVLRVLAPGRP